MNGLHFFLAWLTLCALPGFAQEPEISWGPVATQAADTQPIHIGSSADGQFVMAKTRGMRPVLRRFDEQGALQAQARLNFRWRGETASLVKCVMLQGSLHALLRGWNEDTLYTQLLAQEIDPISLDLIGKPKPMELVRNLKFAPFKVRVSKNEQHLFVLSYGMDSLGNITELHNYVFDATLALRWERKTIVDFPNQLFYIEDVCINNRGDAFISGYLKKSEQQIEILQKTGFKRPAAHSYKIFATRRNGTEQREYSLDLVVESVLGLQFAFRPESDVICAGLYGDAFRDFKGVFSFRIDGESGNLSLSRKNPLPKKFLREIIDEVSRPDEINKRGFVLKDVVVRGDGGITLIGEKLTLGGTWTFKSTAWDIVVVNMDADGNLAWYRKIPKAQIADSHYNSFQLVIGRDKLHFLFNDHKSNLKLRSFRPDDPQRFRNPLEGHLALVSIDADGNVSNQSLMKLRKVGLTIAPAAGIQLSANEIWIYGRHNRKYRYGRLRL
ncbi:MAG: hypothetical protein AAF206_24270 [Bacteroidota bacterium]